MIFYYAHILACAADLPRAIAAAERWISAGGFNPKRFTWECVPCGAVRMLFVSCPRDLAR